MLERVPQATIEATKEVYVQTIVVGFDGSDEARAALGWALEEAKLRKARLRIVHAWSLTPIAVGSFSPGAFPSSGDIEALESASRELVTSAVEDLAAQEPGVPIEAELVRGGAAEGLLSEAEAADLLVVGSRGHGGFAGLLLGSVSQQCASHAGCPVVIVRNGER